MKHRPLTIALISNNYTPYSGGVVSALTSLSTTLRAHGHRVVIITLDFLAKGQPPEFDVIRLNCPIKFTYKTNPMAIAWRPHDQLRTILTQLKPDIIHTHHPFLLGFAAAELARELSIACLFTYHTQYEQYLHYLPLPQLLTKPMVAARIKHYCTMVDAIITPTKTIEEQLRQRGIMRPIHTIPSSIDRLYFEHEQQKEYTKPPCKLLTVSRFTQEKNIPWLLDCFAQLPPNDYSLTIIGFGSEQKNLEQYAQSLGITNVSFIIQPPKATIRDQYDTADLFIFASTTETQGLVMAESMARGTPVIALRAPGTSDIIQHGKNGFLVDSQQAMAAKINECANNRALLKQLSEQARITAQDYHPETVTEQLENLYYTYIKR